MAKKRICFVIAPIGSDDSETRKRSDQVLKHIIEPAAIECGYEAVRADQISEPGLITNQVIQHIVEDDMVVADLTEQNPNVFYELAVCHALRKPVIQIIEKDQVIPFNVKGLRVISIDHRNLDSVDQAKKELSAEMSSAASDSEQESSPLSIVPKFWDALSLLSQQDSPLSPRFGTRADIGDLPVLAPQGKDFYLIGRSHISFPFKVNYLRKRLEKAGASLQVMAMNIRNKEVISVALAQSEDVGMEGQNSFWGTGMRSLAALAKEPRFNSKVKVKLIDYLSPLYIQAVDIGTPSGFVILEIIFPLAEAGGRPVFLVTARDHPHWFRYMTERILDMWKDPNAIPVEDLNVYLG